MTRCSVPVSIGDRVLPGLTADMLAKAHRCRLTAPSTERSPPTARLVARIAQAISRLDGVVTTMLQIQVRSRLHHVNRQQGQR